MFVVGNCVRWLVDSFVGVLSFDECGVPSENVVETFKLECVELLFVGFG